MIVRRWIGLVNSPCHALHDMQLLMVLLASGIVFVAIIVADHDLVTISSVFIILGALCHVLAVAHNSACHTKSCESCI